MSDELWDLLVDTHNHLPDAEPFDTARVSNEIKCRASIVMGTRFSDWDKVEQLANDNESRITPAFGVHPWFCMDTVDTSIPETPTFVDSHPAWKTMEQYLEKFPNALVGEIGLDGVAKDRTTGLKYSFPLQLQLFTFQLAMAVRFHRPCSIHVVHCHGKFYEYLKAALPQDIPPRLALHSFTGSPDIAKGLTRLPNGVGKRIFFGFSSVVSGRSERVAERILAIPDNRILLESDLHDPRDVDGAMSDILEIISRTKGWSLAETAERTYHNAQEFLTGEPQKKKKPMKTAI